jgi:hypothetical protein
MGSAIEGWIIDICKIIPVLRISQAVIQSQSKINKEIIGK